MQKQCVFPRYIGGHFGTQATTECWKHKYREVCNALDMVGFQEQVSAVGPIKIPLLPSSLLLSLIPFPFPVPDCCPQTHFSQVLLFSDLLLSFPGSQRLADTMQSLPCSVPLPPTSPPPLGGCS